MLSLHSVRLVIQIVWNGIEPYYRVTVYPGPRGAPAQVKFSSRDELLERLRAAISDFDEKHLVAKNGATQILFAESMELSDSQLSSLGVV